MEATFSIIEEVNKFSVDISAQSGLELHRALSSNKSTYLCNTFKNKGFVFFPGLNK